MPPSNNFSTTAAPFADSSQNITNSYEPEIEENLGNLRSDTCFDSNSNNQFHSRFAHFVMWSFMIPGLGLDLFFNFPKIAKLQNRSCK